MARNAHTDPANAGLHRHLFHNAAKGLNVKPGENLFAYVYVVPDQVPETIMLEWHDGQGWEHRAFWGADKINFGTANSASRRHMGAVPPAGEWTRLELPAAAVDLEKKTVKGMAFSLFGGKAVWHRSGSIPKQFADEEELVVTDQFSMSQVSSDQWVGKFPLKGSGYYRVELKNELGHPSKQMQEARYVAIPDNPPQIVVERPGTDITLSKPVRVPLAIAAYDDFGLSKVVLAIQTPATPGWESRPILRYSTPVQTDSFLHTLDLPAMNLKPGDVVKYRVEAHDRKEQSRSTPEYSIKIQDDANAADKRLENFEKQQESIKEKFDKLVAEQAKVEQKIEQLKEKNETLTEKVAEAQAEAQKQADAEAAKNPPDPNQPPPAPKPLALDAPTQQALADVRKELAELAKQEEANANASAQIAAELKASAESAAKLELLPPQILDQVKAIPEKVQAEAVKPLQEMTKDLQQGSAADTAPPNLPQMAENSQAVQDNLENLQQQLAAIAEATKAARVDATAGVEKLRDSMLTQQAKNTTKELANLQEFIQNLRKDIQNLEQTEGQLQEATATVPEVMLADVEGRQGKLEKNADPKLAQVKELLANPTQVPESARKARPDSPYAKPDPAAGDDAPQPANDANAPANDPAAAAADAGNPPPPAPFQPALKNAAKPEKGKPKADKPAKPPKATPANPENTTPAGQQKRQDLGDRQAVKMAELEAAENSLGTDLETLAGILDELAEAAGLPKPDAAMAADADNAQPGTPEPMPAGDGQPPMPAGKPDPAANPADGQTPAKPDGNAPPANNPPANPPQGKPAGEAPGEAPATPETSSKPLNAAELAEILNSDRLQEARAMAARMQAAKMAAELAKTGKTPPPKNPNTPQQSTPGGPISQVAALPPSAANMEAVLQTLDLETRTIILKMQPRMREELLQGLREEGPDGYQKFIRNYYQRLAKVKSDKK
ncbi:MAG: hypothetical protein NT069_32165 [Planctomycetota bacterium]|nr:hypothetical protein [Planctomycetota bacterium]